MALIAEEARGIHVVAEIVAVLKRQLSKLSLKEGFTSDRTTTTGNNICISVNEKLTQFILGLWRLRHTALETLQLPSLPIG